MASYSLVWLGWLIAGLAYEIYTLKTDRDGDTLSERVWKLFAVKGNTPTARLRRLSLLVIMMWLTLHFVTGGWI